MHGAVRRPGVAKPPQPPPKHGRQLKKKIDRLQRRDGPLLPDIALHDEKPKKKKPRRRRGNPAARAEVASLQLTERDLEDISYVKKAPSEAARRVGACALTLMRVGAECPADASWPAVISAFADPRRALLEIRGVAATRDVPSFKARALARLLAGGRPDGRLDATIAFDDFNGGGAAGPLGRLADWCARVVRAALAAEQLQDDAPRGRRSRSPEGHRADDDDASAAPPTPRARLRKAGKARRAKKRVPEKQEPLMPPGNATVDFAGGRVLLSSWWRFETGATPCLVSVVAPPTGAAARGGLLVKAYRAGVAISRCPFLDRCSSFLPASTDFRGGVASSLRCPLLDAILAAASRVLCEARFSTRFSRRRALRAMQTILPSQVPADGRRRKPALVRQGGGRPSQRPRDARELRQDAEPAAEARAAVDARRIRQTTRARGPADGRGRGAAGRRAEGPAGAAQSRVGAGRGGPGGSLARQSKDAELPGLIGRSRAGRHVAAPVARRARAGQRRVARRGGRRGRGVI